MQDFNNADVNFMKQMIKHHTMALKMADVVLRSGENPSVKTLAMKIKQAQSTEINLMERWLWSHGHISASKSHSM